MKKLILLLVYIAIRPFERLVLSKKGLMILYTHRLDVTSVSKFRKVLTKITKTSSAISLKSALEMESIDNSYFSFSTDDGLESNCLIDQELGRFGIQLTAFVNSEFIGRKRDEYSLLTYKMDVGESFMRDLDSLKNTVFANHGSSHLDISQLSTEEIIAEILNGDLLRLGHNVPFLRIYSWPFGEKKHYNTRLKEICDSIGYNYVFSAIRGNMKSEPSSYEFIYRDHVNFTWSYFEIMALIYITKIFKNV